MADYYTQFSIAYNVGTPDRLDVLRLLLKATRMVEDPLDDYTLPPSFEYYPTTERGPGTIVFTDEDSANSLGLIVEAIRLFQRVYPDAGPFKGTWACTCSSPRINAFDGGAVVVVGGKAYWHHADDWAEDKLKRLLGNDSKGA